MKISTNNRQNQLRIDRGRLLALIRRFMAHVRRQCPERSWAEVSVVLLDDEGIRPVHLEYFGEDATTDVISFPFPPVPGCGEGWRGEVLVNVERAVREGTQREGVERELALYVAHGCDHLGGACDKTESGRREMAAREKEWLDEVERETGFDGLIRR
jgi:rRNA maturation RNase YbeY